MTGFLKGGGLLALFVIGLLWLTPLPAQAVTGVTVSPAIKHLDIDAADITKQYTLKLTNNTSAVQALELSAQDFGSLNETGGVLLEGSKGYTQKYGLVSWLTLETNSVVLQPGESREVLITIENRQSLRPGGHYGALIISAGGLDPLTGNRVAVRQELSSLILVNKVGGAKYDLALRDTGHDGNWTRLPKNVTLRFQNPGNVHVVPRGLVKLISPEGTVVAQGIINDDSAFVLPESYRLMYVDLQSVGRQSFLPGRYRIEVEYRYDGLERTVASNQDFYFFNALFLVAILAAACVILFRFRQDLRRIFGALIKLDQSIKK